ncbi:MAG: preprotein translocase subunit SecG [Patescibacteria group bacterium]|jgi:preprotein translocase subunit SecG
MVWSQFLIWFQVIIGILLMAVILLQSRGSSLGETFGGSGVFYGTRRGPEKALYYITIVLAILFVISSFVMLFVK